MHDKYTMSICTMITNDWPVFGFDYPLKPQYKPKFEEAFIEYYMFSEIAFEMPQMFRQRLKSYLLNKSEYYNKLLEMDERKFNPLINKSLRECGIESIDRINLHDFENARKQVGDAWELAHGYVDNNFKQNIEETGITNEVKDSDENEHMTQNVETQRNLDQDTVSKEELEKNVDTKRDTITDHTINTDYTSNTDTVGHKKEVSDGESDKITHLEEESTSHSLHKVSDTPQNNLDTLGGQVQGDGTIINKYLTMIESTDTNTTHTADGTENITSHEEKNTDYTENKKVVDNTKEVGNKTEDMTQNEKTDQTTDFTKNIKEDERTTEDTDRVTDTIYHHNIDGSHHFINDEKHKDTTQESTNKTNKDIIDTNAKGQEKYELTEGKKDKRKIEGFENTSLSFLMDEYYRSVRNNLEKFVKEFEPLFMGIY